MAQNSLSSGDQHTDSQLAFSGTACTVQLIPSGEVNTFFPCPTAQNSLRSGDQHMERKFAPNITLVSTERSVFGRLTRMI
jgi:hypothetical protein